MSEPVPSSTAWPAARPTGIKPVQHPAWEEARNAILDLAAKGPVTAILVGESGTGKTWLLRELAAALGDHGFPTMILMQGDLPMSLSTGAALLVDQASLMYPAMRAQMLAQEYGVVVLASEEWPESELDSDSPNLFVITLRALEPDEIGDFAAEWLHKAGLPPAVIDDATLSRLADRSGGRVGTIVQLLGEAVASWRQPPAVVPKSEPPVKPLPIPFAERPIAPIPAAKPSIAPIPTVARPVAPIPTAKPPIAAIPSAERPIVPSVEPAIAPIPAALPRRATVSRPARRRRGVYGAVLAGSVVAIAAGWMLRPVPQPVVIAQQPAAPPVVAALAPTPPAPSTATPAPTTTPAPALPPVQQAETPNPAQTTVADASPPAPTAPAIPAPAASPLPPLRQAETSGPALASPTSPSQPSLTAAPAAPAAASPVPPLRQAEISGPVLATPTKPSQPSLTAAPAAPAPAAASPLPPLRQAETSGPALATSTTPAQPGLTAVPLVTPPTPALDAVNPPLELDSTSPSPTAIASAPPPPVLGPVDPSIVATLDDPGLTIPPPPPKPLAASHAGGPGLVLIAQRGDTLQRLYGSVYRDRKAPPFAKVLAANPGPFKPGAIVIFPEPPGGWQRSQR